MWMNGFNAMVKAFVTLLPVFFAVFGKFAGLSIRQEEHEVQEWVRLHSLVECMHSVIMTCHRLLLFFFLRANPCVPVTEEQPDLLRVKVDSLGRKRNVL